jgi:hypothetical protein
MYLLARLSIDTQMTDAPANVSRTATQTEQLGELDERL